MSGLYLAPVFGFDAVGGFGDDLASKGFLKGMARSTSRFDISMAETIEKGLGWMENVLFRVALGAILTPFKEQKHVKHNQGAENLPTDLQPSLQPPIPPIPP